MPYGDRTGPRGKGPKTGRGLGFCTGNNSFGWNKNRQGFSDRERFGQGQGRGRNRHYRYRRD